MGFLTESNENDLNFIVVLVAQPCAYSKNHWSIHFKLVTCMVYDSHVIKLLPKKCLPEDFPSGPVVESLPANAGDTGSIPNPARFHMPRGN